MAASPAEVAARADVLLSILPDARAVEEVVCGEAGTLGTLEAGTVHIEMSTIDVDRKSRLRDAVAERGGDLLDCPISGSPGMVEPRLATTFASGEAASVEAVRPVLDAISGPWVYTGAFGTGARMKYIASLLLAVHTVAAAEALALARQSGLDLELRVLGDLDAARAADARARLVARARADRHAAADPRPDRGLHRSIRPADAGVHVGQGRVRQGGGRRLGGARHRLCSRPDFRRIRPQSGRISMIYVSHQLPVNVPDEPHLDRAAVWDGLVLKANNALPFVPSMTFCEVIERHSETVFDREIEFRGQRFTERIALEAPHRVVFTRIAGPVLGTIANEIEGPDDDLRLRFSFALVVAGLEGGSTREQEYAESMTGDYLKAVAATLNAVRRMAGEKDAVRA